MNRNKDGTVLTTDQLAAIAVENGLRTKEQIDNTESSLHSEALFRTMLLTLTASTRLEMFRRNELDLA